MSAKQRITPAQRKILEQASRHNLVGLPPREERTAFALSQRGLLHACQGMTDYAITMEGSAALSKAKSQQEGETE